MKVQGMMMRWPQLIHLSSSFDGRRQPVNVLNTVMLMFKTQAFLKSYHFYELPAAPVQEQTRQRQTRGGLPGGGRKILLVHYLGNSKNSDT